MVIRFRIQSFIQIDWEMSESLTFKERPSLEHGCGFVVVVCGLQTDYKTSLSRVESLSEAIIIKIAKSCASLKV